MGYATLKYINSVVNCNPTSVFHNYCQRYPAVLKDDCRQMIADESQSDKLQHLIHT